MEFAAEKSLWKYINDERSNNLNLSPRLSFENDDNDSPLASPRTSCASAASFLLSPANPAAPSPPLSYHCLASLHRTEGTIYSITVTKDFIFTGSSSSRIHIWKQPDCGEIGYVKSKSGEIRAILISGNSLFTAHGDYRIRMWEVSSNQNDRFRQKKITTLPQRRSIFSYPKKNVDLHKDSISCLAYNSKEKLLYTGSFDRTVKVWKISENRLVDSFFAHEGQVNAIVYNQEDGFLFTCSSDGTVKIWRRVFRESSHILIKTLKFQPSPINALALSSVFDTSFLYSGSSDGLINFWEKEKISGRYNHGGFLQGHQFSILCLATIEDLILSGSEDSTVRIWRREDCNRFHSCLVVIDGHHGPVNCLVVAREIDEDPNLLVYSASLDRTMKVWKVKVFPAEKVNLEKSEMKECVMSPVLSPSWVEKKIQGSDF